MKRLILCGVLGVLLVPGAGAAQAAVGVRAGVRSSSLDGGQDVGRVSDLVLGGYMGFGLSDRLALQLELVYGSRGGSGLGLGTDALDEAATPVDVEMRYVEVPMLLRAGFPGQRLMPSFFAGPYAALLLSCDVTAGGASTACDDDAATQRFSPRSTDFGLVVGADLDVSLGSSTVFVDARYSMGFLSIQSASDPMDARHSGFALSGGFAVPLGR